MKLLQNITVASSIGLLVACGGGGGGGSSSDGSGPGAADDVEDPVELVFRYREAPLEPRLFNLTSGSGEPDNHFDPNEIVNIAWSTDLFFSDDTSIDRQYLYDLSLFLSEDEVLDDEDLRLFDMECSIPTASEHACGVFSSFQCTYAPDNENVISCTSIPLDKALGIRDFEIDVSSFLDVIPKSANVILRSCLQEEPENCAEESLALQFN